MIKLGTTGMSKAFVGSTEVSKMYLGSELVYTKEVLPYDAEIKYLKSTGEQWINTLYAFTDNFSFEIDFQGMGLGKSIFGARKNSARTAVLFCGISNTNKLYLNMGSHTAANTPFAVNVDLNARHKVKVVVSNQKATIYVDGVQKYNQISFSGTYISGVEEAIFCTNYGSGQVNELATGKVFSLKMWQGNTLVRDFIPVRLAQVGYMYDKMTGELYGNSGTGNFTLGSDVNS